MLPREIQLELAKSLSRDWSKREYQRRRIDPVKRGQIKANFAEWKKRQRWGKDDFCALMLSIAPTSLDRELIKAGFPYSLLSCRAAVVFRAIDTAEEKLELRFPEAPYELVEWARSKNLTIPAPLKTLRPPIRLKLPRQATKRRAQTISTTLITFANGGKDVRYTHDDTYDVVDSLPGGVSTTVFSRDIWPSIPKDCKAGRGAPRADSKKAWKAKKLELVRALKDALNPSV